MLQQIGLCEVPAFYTHFPDEGDIDPALDLNTLCPLPWPDDVVTGDFLMVVAAVGAPDAATDSLPCGDKYADLGLCFRGPEDGAAATEGLLWSLTVLADLLPGWLPGLLGGLLPLLCLLRAGGCCLPTCKTPAPTAPLTGSVQVALPWLHMGPGSTSNGTSSSSG